LFQPLDVIR